MYAQRNAHLHIYTHTQFALKALYGVHTDEVVVVERGLRGIQIQTWTVSCSHLLSLIHVYMHTQRHIYTDTHAKTQVYMTDAKA